MVSAFQATASSIIHFISPRSVFNSRGFWVSQACTRPFHRYTTLLLSASVKSAQSHLTLPTVLHQMHLWSMEGCRSHDWLPPSLQTYTILNGYLCINYKLSRLILISYVHFTMCVCVCVCFRMLHTMDNKLEQQSHDLLSQYTRPHLN